MSKEWKKIVGERERESTRKRDGGSRVYKDKAKEKGERKEQRRERKMEE